MPPFSQSAPLSPCAPLPHTVPLSLQYNLERATLKEQNSQSLSKCHIFYQQLDSQGMWNFQSVGKMLTQHVTLKMEFSKFDTHILLPKQQLCQKKLAWFQQQNCTKIGTEKVTWQITLQNNFF